jgi:hypothetical protein
MNETTASAVPVGARPTWLVAVLSWWCALGLIGGIGGPALESVWPGWRLGLGAGAMWGLNLLLLVYGLSAPLRLSRPPVLAAVFALTMTGLGSGSYWATVQLYPWYRVGIERAAWFVATCTAVALLGTVFTGRFLNRFRRPARPLLYWVWPRLAATTYLIFFVAVLGTAMAIRRIGYIPILTGDPTSARVDFPDIAGVWYRLSLLGGVVALLVAVQAAARRATVDQYAVGLASLVMVGLYGPRFFVALPLGVAILLWDRVRTAIRVGRVTLLSLVGAPILAVIGYWREQDPSASLLGPLGLLVYGTLGEFRDLGWALDYYGLGDRFLHGGSLGSLVVPLLPAPVWGVLGIDKAAIYSQSSAAILADAMGQTTGQRIGAYGEFYMNYGWVGAVVGAALYGTLLAYLDDRYRKVDASQVRGVFLALAFAVTIFAQVGQLNMFTSTLTGYGYPLMLVVVLASRRAVMQSPLT